MKILDLSLSQNLANSKVGDRGGTVVVVTSASLTGNDSAGEALTQGVRRMFGGNDNKSQKERDLKNCRGYIIKILGLKDYSTKELQNKSLKLGYKIEYIEQILNQLIKDNWVNDERLAQNLVEAYDGRKGKIWLQQKLGLRLIDKETIAKVLSELEILPSQSLKKQVENKYKVRFGGYIEPKTKQKMAVFLAGRGFTNVFGVLKNWETGD